MTRSFPKGLRYITDRERAVDQQVPVASLLQIEFLLNRLPKQLSGGQNAGGSRTCDRT